MIKLLTVLIRSNPLRNLRMPWFWLHVIENLDLEFSKQGSNGPLEFLVFSLDLRVKKIRPP